MPAQSPTEVCRSDCHTFEVPTERKLFYPRVERSYITVEHPVYQGQNPHQSGTAIVSVATEYPTKVCRSDYHTFELQTERKLFNLLFESPRFPESFLSNPVKISINTEQSELRFLPSTLLKYVAPTTIHLKFRLSGSYSTCALEAHLFPLFSLSNPAKIPINTVPTELRGLSGTCLKSVVPDGPDL